MSAIHSYNVDSLARAFKFRQSFGRVTLERLEHAWLTPQAKLRDSLVVSHPTELLCVHDRGYLEQQRVSRSQIMVGVVVPDNKVMYLCDVLNKGASAPYKGGQQISVMDMGLDVAVLTPISRLTEDLLPEVIQECLKVVCPPLGGLPIKWLSTDVMLAIFEDAFFVDVD